MPRSKPLHRRAWSHRARVACATAALLLGGCRKDTPSHATTPPAVVGLEQGSLSPVDRGSVLLGELGCVNCHLPPAAARLDGRRGPDLAAVGARVRAAHLQQFVQDPGAARPGTTMPRLVRDADTAAAIADYLRSFAAEPPPDAAPTPDAVANGRELFHRVGCAACHAPRAADGSELPLQGSVPLGDVGTRYHAAGLRAFLLAPHEQRPGSRMPDLHLTPAEAGDLTAFLLAKAPSATPVAAVDPARVARGRERFGQLRCASCHALPDAARTEAPPAPPLLQLVGKAGGCLEGGGAGAEYALDAQQRTDLSAALAALGTPPSEAQVVQRRLASRNCLACHQRGEAGGIRPERAAFFATGDPSVGEVGRVPPPLTLVGAKLQADWLADAIAHGQAIRPYLGVRMPGFGEAFGRELGALLGAVDVLPPLAGKPAPADDDARRKVRDLGRELVGDQGMNCIACHLFAGERVGTMGAVDLVDSTGQRLRREWFDAYLRAPYRFRPGTLMPQFFVDGVSTRPNLGGGDVDAQIEAIWQYLAEGRNGPAPSGLRHPSIELKVGDEAVLLRRSAQHTGKRAISVGLPGGVNLTFDSETLATNQVWWGRFVDASGVWYGQGSGEVHPLGQELAQLPLGPVFAVLADDAEPWPTTTRRARGDRWLGYDLDRQRVPTFRYVCCGVTIADTARAVAGADAKARPRLRRTLVCTAAQPVALSLLVARAPRLDDLGGGVFGLGGSPSRGLRIALPAGSFRLRAAGAEQELLARIDVRGETTFVCDYAWAEDGK